MLRYISIYLFAVLILAACSTTTDTTRTANQIRTIDRPENLVFPELNPIPVPEVHTFEHNGITFYLVEDPEVPLININTIIKAGSWMQPQDKIGLASITGEVMRSGGTVNFPADELNEFLESRAAVMETSFSLTSGNARMNVLTEDFDEVLPVFIELLTQPAFPEEKLDLAKTQRRSGISRRNDSPSGIAQREFRNLIYGRQTVYSTTLEYDHINNIELEDLQNFHRNAINANNLIVGISGDFKVDEIRPVLEEAFGQIEQDEPNEFDFPAIDYSYESTINFIHRGDMNQSIIRMGHIGGYRDNPDYAALQVMNQVLSGGFSGRLMQEVRTRLGLAYSVGGNYGSNVLYRGQFFAGLSTAGETTAEAIEATMGEIRRLQEEKVSQEELDDTRERFLNSLVFRNSSRASALNEQMNNAYLGLPFDAFEQYVEEVRKVTPEDIYRVANEYLRPDALHILVVGNPDLVGDQLDQFGDVREIDISIPRPGALEERGAISGDAEAGRTWMQQMASRILDGNDLSGMEFEGKLESAQLPPGMVIDVVLTYDFENEGLSQQLITPMGTQTLKLENGSAVMEMQGQQQPLPGEVADMFKAMLNRHYASLSRNADSINAEYIGTEEHDGKEVAVVYIHEIEGKLFIDKSTNLPVKLSYEQFNPEAGSDVEVVVTYANWTEKDGVMSAHELRESMDGEQVSKYSFSSHSRK